MKQGRKSGRRLPSKKLMQHVKRLLSFLSIGLMLTLLPGCATALSSSAPIVVNQCPPLNSYQREELNRLADEIERDPTAVRNKFITDYSKLRDACRAIEKKKSRPSQ